MTKLLSWPLFAIWPYRLIVCFRRRKDRHARGSAHDLRRFALAP